MAGSMGSVVVPWVMWRLHRECGGSMGGGSMGNVVAPWGV